MVDEYIKRKDVLKVLCDKCVFEPSCSRENEFCNQIQGIKAIPAADVEPKRKWIPVTDAENLPKRSTPCLVACNQWGGEIVRKATWLASERIFHENGRDITEYVTHWMDSPRAPKEEGHEEV